MAVKRWAEYLTFIVTAPLLPFEVYELTHKVSPLKVIALIINIAVVVYLLSPSGCSACAAAREADEAERERDSGWPAIDRGTRPPRPRADEGRRESSRSATGTPTTAGWCGWPGYQLVDPDSGRYLGRDAPSSPSAGCGSPAWPAPAPPRRGARSRGRWRRGGAGPAARPGQPARRQRDRRGSAGGGEQVGWVPREIAAELAPELDAGKAVVGGRAARAARLAARPPNRPDDAAGRRRPRSSFRVRRLRLRTVPRYSQPGPADRAHRPADGG